MICYRDTTFCASPNCQNACGRKLTEFELAEAKKLGLDICYAYFCDKPHLSFSDKDETVEDPPQQLSRYDIAMARADRISSMSPAERERYEELRDEEKTAYVMGWDREDNEDDGA